MGMPLYPIDMGIISQWNCPSSPSSPSETSSNPKFYKRILVFWARTVPVSTGRKRQAPSQNQGSKYIQARWTSVNPCVYLCVYLYLSAYPQYIYLYIYIYIYISIYQSINQSVSQSINQSVNQSISQSINRSVSQLINRSINLCIFLSVRPSVYLFSNSKSLHIASVFVPSADHVDSAQNPQMQCVCVCVCVHVCMYVCM